MGNSQEVFLAKWLFLSGFIACNIWCCNGTHDFKIASFNIQIFGKSKMDKPHVVETLSKIIRQYDIIFIQEIRDKSGEAIYELLDVVNTDSGSEVEYDLVLSERLGRTSSKEQYAFMYRKDIVIINDNFTTSDKDDVYEREPLAVLVSSPTTVLQRFAIIGVHIKPDDVVIELNALNHTYFEVYQRWNVEDVLIMGDLNADCSYLSQKKQEELVLQINSNFEWLIQDGVDTTVSNSDCAYDRFIASGQGLRENIEKHSAKEFRFDEAYNLDQETALEVSDHYPIELSLKTLPPGDASDASQLAIRHLQPVLFSIFFIQLLIKLSEI